MFMIGSSHPKLKSPNHACFSMVQSPSYSALRDEILVIPRILEVIASENGHNAPDGPCSPDSVLLYTYTGGTTKHSKCVVVTLHGRNAELTSLNNPSLGEQMSFVFSIRRLVHIMIGNWNSNNGPRHAMALWEMKNYHIVLEGKMSSRDRVPEQRSWALLVE